LLLGKKKRGWVARCDTLLLLSSACPPRIVARTQGYTYAAKVWALSLVQGPFSVNP
jgi:hypothetical protein